MYRLAPALPGICGRVLRESTDRENAAIVIWKFWVALSPVGDRLADTPTQLRLVWGGLRVVRDYGRMTRDELWRSIDAERRALIEQLEPLSTIGWAKPSLCSGLTVREVLAHMTVCGAVSAPRWFLGVLRARFDFDKQVHDRLREQLGTDQQDTLARFRSTLGSRTSPPLPVVALLGEMVVHGEDIRRPLGLTRAYPQPTLDALLSYYAGTDQVVIAKKRVAGLRLEATDSGITVGHGEPVRGTSIALIMAMTGRQAYCAELSGPGVSVLKDRCL